MKRGFKVTDKSRKKMIGVASDSLRQLLQKARQRLDIREAVTAALDDGTIVDDEDYFQALPPQTVIILYRKTEDIVTGVDFVLDVLRRVNLTYLDAGSKAMDALLDKAHEIMNVVKSKEEENFFKNTQDEDPEWFDGLETNAKTKDEFMNRRSRERIRGYLYKFQEDVRRSQLYAENNSARKILRECIEFFKRRLRADGYFGCYFDRRFAAREDFGFSVMDEPEHDVAKRFKFEEVVEVPRETSEDRDYDKFSFCDSSGNFVCQGIWNTTECKFSNEHRINPYASRKTRILFSTWNLDHKIERSRSMVPALLSAVEHRRKSQYVNYLYFYQLLFTKFNVKLVHVVCHDKSFHDLTCDTKSVYV